jgi:class 3 adenylate cyclase
VKTIGDAVMATFETPDGPLRCNPCASDERCAERQLEPAPEMGIHEGSCLAVTLNGQQDF